MSAVLKIGFSLNRDVLLGHTGIKDYLPYPLRMWPINWSVQNHQSSIQIPGLNSSDKVVLSRVLLAS